MKNGSGKAKFDISDGVQLVESKGMKIPELKRAQEIAEEEVQLFRFRCHCLYGPSHQAQYNLSRALRSEPPHKRTVSAGPL